MAAGVPIGGVDHIVVAVRSLEAAGRRYRNLGFKLTPQGGHPAFGSINHTALFYSGDYFELLEVAGGNPFTSFYRDFAEAAEGVAGLALRVDDAQAAYHAAAAAGLRPEPPLQLTRPVDLPQGQRTARFTLVHLPLGSLPGGRVFLVQHHDPDLVWLPDMLDHPNRALGLSSLVLVDRDPQAAAEAYAALLGTRVEASGRTRSVRIQSVSIDVMTPEDFAHAFADEDILAAALPRFAAVTFCVEDLEETAALLSVNGLRFRGDGAITVAASEALGVHLVFEPWTEERMTLPLRPSREE